MAADSSTSAQRRRATKPLIEKRRRARINSSLAQLKEIVAKPNNKAQETRSNRLEKADILEMTVDYVKRLHERTSVVDNTQKDATIAKDLEQCFKDGYKLCMSEVENFFFKNYQRQASKEFLSRSLQNYLMQVYQKNLTREEKLCQNGTTKIYNASASATHKHCNVYSDSKTSQNISKDNYEPHSENSDLGFSYSCASTDDEMAESNSNVEFKDNSEVIESYLFSNGSSPMKDVPYSDNHIINPSEHVWRPW